MTVSSADVRSALATSVRELRRMRTELETARRMDTEPIAVVGMACRMPGAEDSDSFWRLLRDGGDAIGPVPPGRWNADSFYDPTPGTPGKIVTRNGGFLADVEHFDAAFFGVSPREAAQLDPQQRLLLEVSWEALEHAAIDPLGLAGSDTGVFFGVTAFDYTHKQMRQLDPTELEIHTLTGTTSTFAAGRLSYWLGLTGPSMSVDTACSSSLVGVHLACQSLRAGETSTALAGGVNLMLTPEWSVVLSKGQMLSPDGRCKTFDAAADGYGRAEGCGVVVLKRLSDAVAQGDPILAVIRGSAVNQDGRSSGITVPNLAAQREVIRRALRMAAVEPSEVSYVEAHGTGTPLGDPIEVRALSELFRERRDGPLLLGSVKTNVGHLEAASGIAGLIKVILALRHEEIPPHLHLTELNPDLGLDESVLAIPVDNVPWPSTSRPRIAGVSSFGASGTNSHVVVQEPPDSAPAARTAPEPTAHLLVLSAKTREGQAALARRYADQLATVSDAELGNICFTAAQGRSHFPYRMAVAGGTAEAIRRELSATETSSATRTGHARPGDRPEPVFLFTGQGAQHETMGRLLDETEPAFRQTIDECAEILRPHCDHPLRAILFPAPGDEGLIHETRYTQPALLAFEYALAQLWRSWGIEPVAVLGHSVGELAAACVAGVMSIADGLRLAAVRGRLMQDLTAEGAMASVFAPVEAVRQAMDPYAAELSIAAVNGAQSVVVSGNSAALDRVLAIFGEQGVKATRLTTTRAFHSPLMEPMLDELERVAASIRYAAPSIPLISNLTGEPLLDGFTARYLRDHARQPVQFLAGMTWLLEQGYDTFVEIGPSATLSALGRRLASEEGNPAPVFLPSLRPGHDDWQVISESIGELYVRGARIGWAALHRGRDRRRVRVPTYPFQRERHWLPETHTRPAEVAAVPAAPPAPTGEQVGTPQNGGGDTQPSVPAHRPAPSTRSLLGARLPSPLETVQFAGRLDPEAHDCLIDCVMDGLPVVNIGVYLETALAAAREVAGPGPVIAEESLVRQGLVLNSAAPIDTQLLLDPLGDGRFAYRYFADHRMPDAPPNWILHAQGTVGIQPVETPTTDLAAIRRRLTEEVAGDEFYRRMWRRRFYLGPSARWIDHIWQGPGEVLARMRAPLPGEVDSYLVHPGLTDAAFQTLLACLPPQTESNASYLLVGIDKFVLHRAESDWVRGSLHCHATLSLSPEESPQLLTGQVRLLDETGRIVLAADGAYLKRADRDSLQPVRPTAEPGRPDRADTSRSSAVSHSSTWASPRSGQPHRSRTPAHDVPAERASGDPTAAVIGVVARVLGARNSVDPDEPLQHLGFDSLMALELRDALRAELGVTLPLVGFLDGRSVNALAEQVRAMLGGSVDDSRSVANSGDECHGAVGPEVLPRTSAPDQPEPSGVSMPDVATSTTVTTRVDLADRYDAFPLTDLQQAYLLGRADTFELGNTSTYFFVEVDVDDLDLDLAEIAFQRLIARHDMLRAVITPDNQQRVLAQVPPYRFGRLDLRGRPNDERNAELARLTRELSEHVVDVTAWPLFDVRATLLDDRRTRLHLGLDALIVDAWSTSTLFSEWVTLYQRPDNDLPALTQTYRNYLRAVQPQQDDPARRRAWEYWRSRLATLPPAPKLPLAIEPATVRKPRFVHRSWRLPARQWQNFKRFAHAAGVTPSAALCAAYAQVLATWSESPRFTLNLLVFNRQLSHPQAGALVGQLSATTLLEVDAAGGDSFRAHAHRLGRQLWNDLEHGQVTGVEVLREFNQRHGVAGTATMPVVFASTVGVGRGADGATGIFNRLAGLGSAVELVNNSIRTPQVWLDHQVVEEGDELVVNWDVVEEIFPAGMIDAMFAAYLNLLAELCATEDAWNRAPAVPLAAEDLADREEANSTAHERPSGLLHEPFTRQAATDPDRIAVIAPARTLTYGQLDELSDQVARWLRAHGAGVGCLVGIVMDRGWEQIVGALGVLKSGAAYVPIDASLPQRRRQLLLQRADISLVLTQSSVAVSWPAELTCCSVDTMQVGHRQDGGSGPASEDPLVVETTAQDLAYVIFTSGSTGTPKGVMIEHGSALNTIVDINQRFRVGPADRVLALSAMSFDLSVYDVFGTLAAGGAIVLPERKEALEPRHWLDVATKHGVTVWNSVPMLAEMFVEYLSALPNAARLAIRLMMLSGDWVPVSLPGRFHTLVPGAECWSLGGATEASIWSIAHRTADPDVAWSSVPYGTPLRNQRWYVLDDAMRPRPRWVPGELYIAGDGLARGYLADEPKTRAAFVRHPVTGERLYRTGDLGRYRPGGVIEFLGRRDQQVKIGGFRIELGEVEAALSRCPGVRAAVAAAVGEARGARQLAGFVVLASGTTVEEVERAVREELPEYLVPYRLVALDELPMTVNGKVDRSALAESAPQAAALTLDDEPIDEVDRAIAAIWTELFPTRQSGISANFFDLGGNSLLAVRLMSMIAERLGVSLPLAELFARPTIALLGEAVRRAVPTDATRGALVPIQKEGDQPPLFFVHPVGGDVLCYADLAARLGASQPFYALQSPERDAPFSAMVDLAAHYVQSIIAVEPSGPYRLGGWSMGGVIALEMGRQLMAAGREVEWVLAIDLLEPPNSAELEPVDDSVLLAWFARDLAAISGTGWPVKSLERSDAVSAETVHRDLVEASILPAEIDMAAFKRLARRFADNARLLHDHRARPFLGPVHFFRAADGGASVETAKAWGDLHPDFTLVDVPGDHYSVLRPPHVDVVAKALHDVTGLVPEPGPGC
ncbi:amino acid adenylation domain-containing protein [Micromonospora arborensis]|uniref:non-ribosomal peptide synthetase/type I polyketide synthase n=1 Tax=Micromonospora arborensis TaxID=2116518 RepID=UPI003420C247